MLTARNTMTPGTRRPIRHERVTGEAVLDIHGHPSQPSEAASFHCATPVPTMLVPRELNYLYWLAAGLSGTGRVVELGCFLGGSTSALAAGVRVNPRASRPLLTYDAFAIPEELHPDTAAWLRIFGLSPGEQFRPRFDHFNRPWLDLVDVREGWLPMGVTPSQEREVYPEQAPIELLFVDVAKAWDVHITVLRAFGRHVLSGGVLVQQDFFDLQTPWIPLHMWQLREVLEPLDVLYGTPTVGFRCRGNITPHLDDLWSEALLRDRRVRRAAWEAVQEYWAGYLGQEGAGFLHGHACMHAIMAGDADEATRQGRLYEAWSRSAESEGVYFSPAWPDVAARLAELVETDGRAHAGARMLAAECVLRGSRLDRPRPGERAAYYPVAQRRAAWTSAISQLEQAGRTRIALFGAGRHTRWLLEEGLLKGRIEVMCIVDDAPVTDTLVGVPVVTPDDALSHLRGVDVILPSSDAFEPHLLARAHELFGDRAGLEVRRVYTAVDAVDSLQPGWEYDVDLSAPCDRVTSSERVKLSDTMPERAQLGLPERRDWVEAFASRFVTPAWATGYTNHLDAAFLWDVVEAVRPRRIVEIGTASGVSTAMLLAAAARFGPADALVYSFDLASRCYFDDARPLASAIAAMAPDLAGRARLFARANAVDAASCFRRGEVDLAFIDGNHAHPAPVLDLLALLYALKPGAWVILHDIELSALQQITPGADWGAVTGAEQLFRAWPWAKVQPSGEHPAARNVGAIRMPQDARDVIPVLLDLLRTPWEMGDDATPAVCRTLAQVRDLSS